MHRTSEGNHGQVKSRLGVVHLIQWSGAPMVWRSSSLSCFMEGLGLFECECDFDDYDTGIKCVSIVLEARIGRCRRDHALFT